MPELKEKLLDLAEAASLIKDGSRIAIGGFPVHNHPMAFVHELIRRNVKGLTIVGCMNGIEIDMLVGAGCVQKVETSCVALEEFGLAMNFRRAVERGEVQVAEYSENLAFDRFMCSARGQPFFVTRQLYGTDLPKYNNDIKEIINPFDGLNYHAIPAAEPDWVIVHAPMGDKYGNALYFEKRQIPLNQDIIMTQSSNNLIVTVDQIIDRNRVLRMPHLNMIPRYKTTAIVETPFGAHPTSCLHMYEYDRKHLRMYAQAGRDPAKFKRYLDKYVYGVKSHAEYLERIGIENLMVLRTIGGNL